MNDPVRQQWEKDKTGLYATNGGALAMLLSSSANMDKQGQGEVKGRPVHLRRSAAFRGYYWNWSNELLKRTKGAVQDQRNLWTWVILKAYTDNNHGSVALRSSDPFDVPDINFRSFVEGPPGHLSDIAALCEAVERTRAINSKIKGMKGEIQPGANTPEGSADLAQWVQDEAWGHHACGTCRIGSDRQWRPDVKALQDKNAVLHSNFKVHGVDRLRVVDASVFPRIPGYFIVTPVFMIGEKAADAILADSVRPIRASSEALEAPAGQSRGARARGRWAKPPADPAPWPSCRRTASAWHFPAAASAAPPIALGFLQALAATRVLRRVDFMSSVSGGGYAGGFLGRLFMCGKELRPEECPTVPRRVQAALANTGSAEMWWLRAHANYIAGEGRSDATSNVATIWRNLVATHLCMGAFFRRIARGSAVARRVFARAAR